MITHWKLYVDRGSDGIDKVVCLNRPVLDAEIGYQRMKGRRVLYVVKVKPKTGS